MLKSFLVESGGFTACLMYPQRLVHRYIKVLKNKEINKKLTISKFRFVDWLEKVCTSFRLLMEY